MMVSLAVKRNVLKFFKWPCSDPNLLYLDETDSGLDIDALRIVSEGVNALRGPELGVMVITHYQRILNYIKPDVVHVMMNGRIVRIGRS